MSVREASRVFGLHRDTVRKMLAYSVPPGYRRQGSPRRPKLNPFTGVIDRILDEDHRVPKKQRHTVKRIFEPLRDEYGFDGGYTVVKDYVREHRRQTKEMFVPLSHSPGQAQCDFGEAWWSSAAWSGRPTASSWTCPTATAASSRPIPPRPPIRLRSHPLPAAVGAEDGGPGPGGSLAGVGPPKMNSARCADYWSRAWAGEANGSTCRCSGCWRLSRWKRCTPRSGTPCG